MILKFTILYQSSKTPDSMDTIIEVEQEMNELDFPVNEHQESEFEIDIKYNDLPDSDDLNDNPERKESHPNSENRSQDSDEHNKLKNVLV